MEGRPLDYGLPAVRSVEAVGGGSASGPGDGRRPPTASGGRGRGGGFHRQADVAESDTSAEERERYDEPVGTDGSRTSTQTATGREVVGLIPDYSHIDSL